MTREEKEARLELEMKFRNNDSELVKFEPDKNGNPVKWVRDSVNGDWRIYQQYDTPEEAKDHLFKKIAIGVIIFIAFAIIYQKVTGEVFKLW